MIKLGTQSVKIPYAKAYVGDDLVYTTDVGDALLTENGRPITTELGEYLDYESVPYTMLDWIESTGTQWIDTGILNSSTIKVETKMSAQGIGCMNGSEYTWDGQRFKWGTSGTGVLYYGYGSGSHSLSTTPTLDMAYTFYMSRGEQWVKDNSGTPLYTSSDSSITTYSTMHISLFSVYNGTRYQNAPLMRIYYCKIYDGDTLVRDFIPVLDETNQTPCLYDKVSETYFYNQGTGDFIPSEFIAYTTLGYIESTGTQYIDTGLYPYQTQTKAIFQMNETGVAITGVIMGCHGGGDNRYYPVAIQVANNRIATADRQNNYYALVSPIDQLIHTVIYNNADYKVLVDETEKATVSNLTTQSQTKFLIFARSTSAGAVAEQTGYKLFYLQLYNKSTSTIARELIPVKRKSDNVLGLYDRANDTFYTNAGTGTFLYG